MNTILNNNIAKKVAETLLSVKAVSINTKKPFRYVSGILAPLYTDNRLLISHPKEWDIIIESYINVIKKYIGLSKVQVLSGTATAAIPHAAVLSNRLKIPMVYVRSSKKDHGKENLIEGDLKPESNVLIIEDLITTGLSIKGNITAIKEAKGKVMTCLAITTSTLSAFEANVSELGISLITLTNIQTVVDVAKEKKYINEKQYKSIQSFLHDPRGWGKRMGFE